MRAHFGHTLLAIFRGGKPQLLDERAIKGAWRVKTDQRADLCDAERGVEQISASLGNAQRVDIIIEAKSQSSAEQV